MEIPIELNQHVTLLKAMQSSQLLQQKIGDAFERVREEDSILFLSLSDWAYALLIPSSYRYTEYESRQIAREIQQNILPERNPGSKFHIMSWQDVIHENQHRGPAFSGWKSAGQVQVLFFIADAAIGLASRSLWLGQEISETLGQRQVEQIKKTNKLEELKQFLPEGISFEEAYESWRKSGKSIESWAKNLRACDWANLGKSIQVTLRSLSFQKVRPHALTDSSAECLWAIQVEQKIVSGKSKELFEHYWSEARRFLGNREYECQVSLHEDPSLFASIFVGDQIASIAAFPELVAGALKPFVLFNKQVRLFSFCEDAILVMDPMVSSVVLSELTQKAKVLLQDLNPDGYDALKLDQIIELPSHPCGTFIWREVPAPYFDLVYAAEEGKSVLAPGRSEYLRGLSYEIVQAWPKAVESFQIAFKYNFSDGDICHALGRALIETGEFREAVTFLERAAGLLPDDPDISNGLGIAHLESGHQISATRSLENAVALAPEDVQFLSNLGRCYFSGKRFKEAESVLYKALEYSPNFSDAHAMLAQIKWRLGELEIARKHARKAFASNPGSQYTQDLLWALSVDKA